MSSRPKRRKIWASIICFFAVAANLRPGALKPVNGVEALTMYGLVRIFALLGIYFLLPLPGTASRRLRRSARVFLFDPSGRILLIRLVTRREDGPFSFWVTPGGEVERGESDRVAAERELLEELGLRVCLQGPVHEESGGTYTHLGETVRNFDVFFVAECEHDAPKLAGVTDVEIALMQEARWWSMKELQATEERVFPAEIATIAAEAWRWKKS